MATKAQRLNDFVELKVNWISDLGLPWYGHARVGAAFLERLTNLAAKAPKESVDRFINDFTEESECPT